MPSLIQWNLSYSVGNQLLDEQHRNLLQLCKMAENFLREGSAQGTEEFFVVLGYLCDYAAKHFRAEESLLLKYAYPFFEEHKLEHEEFVSKLTAFFNSAVHGNADKQGVHQFLTRWWLHHILDSDMQYRDIFIAADHS